MIITEYCISRDLFRTVEGNPNRTFISIHDGGDKPPKRRGNWLDGIVLEFDDADYDWLAIDGLVIKDQRKIKMFSDHQANKVLDKVMKWNELPQEIEVYVHCLAGVSRSPAIVKFIRDYITVRTGHHNLTNYTSHNHFVYNTLVDAFEKRFGEEEVMQS